VPLAEDGGGVAKGFDQLGQDRLVGVDAVAGTVVGGTVQPDAVRITSGEQGGPGRSADRLGHIEVREADTLGGHAVQVRGLEALGTVAAHIPISLVVGEDQDDVGKPVLFPAACAAAQSGQAHRGRAPTQGPQKITAVDSFITPRSHGGRISQPGSTCQIPTASFSPFSSRELFLHHRIDTEMQSRIFLRVDDAIRTKLSDLLQICRVEKSRHPVICFYFNHLRLAHILPLCLS
jgi:hypothetical protein